MRQAWRVARKRDSTGCRGQSSDLKVEVLSHPARGSVGSAEPVVARLDELLLQARPGQGRVQELDAVLGGTLGASRMNYALAKSYFDHMGLVAGVYTHRRASRIKS